MKELSINALKRRGVEIDDIVECVKFLQEGYQDSFDEVVIKSDINDILSKREVQHAILTGISIDESVENNTFGDAEITRIIQTDDSLYGVDEVLAYGICNLYGSIALTNFGFIDRVKPGIVGRLNDEKDGVCNTYLDDIVGAIAAAAASKSAHNK